MAYANLGAFLKTLEEKGQLMRVEAEVDPILEISEITDRVVKKGGPALFFSHVKGSSYPVVTNLFGTMERMALALGDPVKIGKSLEKFLKLPELLAGKTVDKLRLLAQVSQAAKLLPVTVKNAPCQEVVDTSPDLAKLPILKCWPGDAGRFITLPLVFTKDPQSGQRNCGMYRMQVFDGTTTGLHWHLHKDAARHFRKSEKNTRLEAAVALGGDPAVIYAATAPLPPGVDEMVFASFLRKNPVEMVKCKTVDLEVPAQSEFVLEGYLDPTERRPEGPFGDHTGFYSPVGDFPVFHLTCLTHKKEPVYPATLVGRPPMEDYFLGKATERIFLPVIRVLIPEIVEINFPPEGVFHNCLVVSIKKEYPGQAKKVMYALWGLPQLQLTKLIIVVDEEIDVRDMSAVWWRVFGGFDAARDVVIVQGPLDELDYASPLPCYGSKMGIDATRKGPAEGHPRPWPVEVEMLSPIKEMVSRRWQEYGFRAE